jgi:uncharacterized protein YqjF (DUF2071 family)
MLIDHLRFTPALLSKPAPRILAAETTLEHFAIVTYWVDPASLRRHLHPRFEPVCLEVPGTRPQALISVVTFLDRDFRFIACPWLKRSFGQTNYRAYVQDTRTGEQVVWFFGTCLDSVAVYVPRHVWRLPWHPAKMVFDCRYDERASRYERFNVTTQSRWAPGHLTIVDSGTPVDRLPGVSNLEAGLVLLTHPMRGYFFRRDGALGSYAIWHERAELTTGALESASYPLLEKLGLVANGDLGSVHSVLVQPRIGFTIYLPPSKV